MPNHLIVHPALRPLRGKVRMPSDKSISHRALLLSALASGTSRISRFSYGEDNLSTLAALEAMGVTARDDGKGELVVGGVGLDGLRAPQRDLDCGNSGTTMRLMAGLLAAQPFVSRLVGDASLSRRPMARVANPIRARGGRVEGRPHPSKPDEITAPLEIGPRDPGRGLKAVELSLEVASAQVKSALLLSGLRAEGPTRVLEPSLSRDHTERMLGALGGRIETEGTRVTLQPFDDPRGLSPFEVALPGDLSAAAFILVAASLVESSEVAIEHVGINPSRTGILEVLESMGSELRVLPESEALGEPVATLELVPRGLSARELSGELVVRAIDEIPIICALATRAVGVSEMRDLAELRVKESDRVASMAKVLGAFGVPTEERSDGISIEGRVTGRLRATEIESGGDHRIAMTAVVLGLVADGPTKIRDVDCIATSFPRFVETLRALGAEIEVVS